MRLAKAIAASGLCSRREAERRIEQSRVVVNHETVVTPAFNVSDSDVIEVDGKPLPEQSLPQICLFHKPKNCLTTRHDPQGRETIYDHLPKIYQSWHSIGRLDFTTEGLLLLTNDGALKREMEHPSTGLERVYRVRVRGVPEAETLNKLNQGIALEGTRYRPVRAIIEQSSRSNSWLRVTLTEGKNREIRRLFEHFDHPVSRLIRVSYGEYQLGKLPVGEVKPMKIPKLAIASSS